METEQLREIDIRNYWPPVVGNTDEFQQIAEAENPEFNNLQACIWRALQDSFVQDATEYGVKRWEKILNISPENGDTIETRKERILTYLNIKLPYTWRVLNQMLIGLLGEGNFTMTFNNDTATLTVAVALDTTEAQIADVKTLLDRVLPRNLVTEMEWADGLPMSYTRLEYLESTETQYIDTGVIPQEGPLYYVSCDMHYLGGKNIYAPFLSVLGLRASNGNYGRLSFGFTPTEYVNQTRFVAANKRWYRNINPVNPNLRYRYAVKIRIDDNTPEMYIDGQLQKMERPGSIHNEKIPYPFFLFAQNSTGTANNFKPWRIFSCEMNEDESPKFSYIPALDNTGAPCMYDLVSKQPFYNSGTGDFLYPGAEQAVQTLDLDLDAKSYAKLTHNGIRRLYHVPKGYTGTMDDYAAANGFKELIEPPMPLEGYWMPEWRETETQLICDWVETEPPTEPEPMEVTENE